MAVALTLLALLAPAAAYLPGLPNEYKPSDGPLTVYVDKLTSEDTLVPYNYYSMDFCKPKGGEKQQSENLGQWLYGSRIENSPYEVTMMQSEPCKVLCVKNYNRKKVKQLQHLIKEEYHVSMLLDDLPAASTEGSGTDYAHGYRLGLWREESSSALLYNHLSMTIDYHIVDEDSQSEDPAARIVGFRVEPRSHQYPEVDAEALAKGEASVSCDATQALVLKSPAKGSKQQVVFTYDVFWKHNTEIAWATRLDVYLNMGGRYPEGVHWFNVINASLIVLFLSLMLALIIKRNVYRDLERYDRKLTEAERQETAEDYGWKLVHADIFRAPHTQPMLLCVCVGTGTQLLLASVLVVGLSAIGFLSPATRGLTMIAAILIYVLLGGLAGYVSARLYKTMKGKQWQRTTLLTAAFWPSIAFGTFFVVNLFLWGAGSSAAVPFRYMFALVALFLFVSTPSVFAGAYFGYRAPAVEHPVQTSNIPRSIPDTPWWQATPIVAACAGILPFGAVFVEAFFCFNALFMNSYYSWFGVLALVVVVLVVTVAEITIVMIYFQLCSEDYRVWWRSIVLGGSCGFYLFLYSIMYFSSNFQDTDTAMTGLIFFCYVALLSFFVFLATGAVGFFATLWFTRLLFSSVKVD